ncbi:MAG: amino acid adenylation domain-containing protein [Rhodospirillales bacterium]|nr:amino acid adenylation domain-containing protein [Rhodospirillales bacterium]
MQGLRSASATVSPAFTAGFRAGSAASTYAEPRDLELIVDTSDSGARPLRLLYRSDLFEPDTIERFGSHLRALLAGIAAAPDTAVGQLPIMSPEEAETVVSRWNASDAPWPQDACIHHLFEAQASADPSRIALIAGDRKITYGELLGRVDRVAALLVAHGVGPDVPVALLLERSVETVVAIYAVLKAGGFYVPIDDDCPRERIAAMLADAAPPVAVTHSELVPRLPADFQGAVLCMDALPPASDRPLSTGRAPTPASAVYCLYTSGSTGEPKGVVVEHRALVRRIQWFQDQFPLTPNDRVMNKTPYVFGISEWEYFWAPAHGATLVIAAPGAHKDPVCLHHLMVESRATVGFFVPSQLALLLEHMDIEELNGSTCATRIFTCGEALAANTCSRFFAAFDARLVNLYGPTEADMTYWECPRLGPGEVPAKIPIGKPMSNVRAYVLDEQMQPVPVGVPGELYLGASHTARGYLNRPELTAERFLADPFSQGRLYRTGDLAQWLPDGNLEYLGRIDLQVKLRGFRIELGEIESVLRRCDGVEQAVVALRGDDAASLRLIGYVTPETAAPDAVLAGCRKILPEYMVPSSIVAMERLPMSARQKIDRAALPDPLAGETGAGEGRQLIPARTEMEQTIERIWRDVLRREEPISTDADFVRIGGTSLLAGRATTRIRRATGVNLPGTAMYTHPTISALASLLEAKKRAAPGDAAPPRRGDGDAARAAWKGESPTAPRSLAWQVLGIMLTPFTSDAVHVVIAYVLAYVAVRDTGLWAMALAVPVVMVLETVLFALLALGLKRLLLGRTMPGRYPLYGRYYLRWWLVDGIVGQVTGQLESLCGATGLFNVWYRLLGARVGKRVRIESSIDSPDLVTIGDDVVIDRDAQVNPIVVENGEFTARPISIAERCRIAPRAYVTAGTALPAGVTIGPLSTTSLGNSFNMQANTDPRPVAAHTLLHNLIGIPVVLLLYALPVIPEVVVLEALYGALAARFGDAAIYFFYAALPWTYLLVLNESFFLEVVLLKRLVVGRFEAGPRSHTRWDVLRRWLMRRVTGSDLFVSAMRPWVGTEILSFKYRLLGAKIGRRVAVDFFDAVEYDMVTVGDNCMFGAGVTLVTSDDEETLPIVIGRRANVLDTCCLMPGVTVGEGALCGSSTLGPKGHSFPAFSVWTGNQGGAPILLRQRAGDIEIDHAGIPEDERAMVAQARRRHGSTGVWLRFNLWVVLSAILWTPLPELFLLGVVVLWLHSGLETWALVALTPPVYLAMNVLHAGFVGAVKWIVFGRIREGNYPFYGVFHHKWSMWIHVLNSVEDFADVLSGTLFAILFNRLLGLKAGRNVYMMDTTCRTREFDLITVGDETSVNADCMLSCHTVENMVLKLAPATTGRRCSLRGGAVMMPGASMEDGATLLEQSQVLKGETVPAGEVWAGLPAVRMEVPPEQSSPPRNNMAHR